MPTERRPHRSLLALLVVVALVASRSPAAAARSPQLADLRPRDAGIATVPAQGVAGVIRHGVDFPALRSGLFTGRPGGIPAAPRSVASIADGIGRPTTNVPAPSAKSESTTKAGSTGGSTAAASKTYQGKNRVWIPALGINRSVAFYGCDKSSYPGDRVYRWGCGGRNNVYLFGHAHSVFKPLHDAYVRGRLTKGMKVHYADGSGKVSTYAVIWWRLTTPDKGEFAYTSLAKPSMTLQTCVGKDNKYRLIVRLVRVG
ncbi:MAG: sortase [Chloroflexota bacterium]